MIKSRVVRCGNSARDLPSGAQYHGGAAPRRLGQSVCWASLAVGSQRCGAPISAKCWACIDLPQSTRADGGLTFPVENAVKNCRSSRPAMTGAFDARRGAGRLRSRCGLDRGPRGRDWLDCRVILKPTASVGAERGGARIGIGVRAPAPARAEIDFIHVRGRALLEQRQKLMLRAIEAAHAGIRLRSDNEVEGNKTELGGGRMDRRVPAPVDEGREQAAIG